MLFGGIGIVAAFAACAPADRPRLTELFYDAVGDDTGHEFVEIHNPSPFPASLAGLRLEAGDGAGPGRWVLRWTGQSGDSITARGRFVVGGSRVVPSPQAIAALDLQNGPDAIRLVWPDGATEVLGYGALALPEYTCGEPAPDVPSGQSLARVPDDSDLGSNALDFRPAAPSPGRANRPDRDAAWVAGVLSLDPERPDRSGSTILKGSVTNRGAAALAAGEIRLAVSTRGGFGAIEVIETPLAPALSSGDTARFEAPLSGLPEGKQTLACRLVLAGDEAPENDLDSLGTRVGPGPLEITEIQFHPAGGEGEWVEVRNASADALDLAAFTLADRGLASGRPAEGEIACEPESLALLAQDRATLISRRPELDPRRVWQVSPWASLNNSDDSSGVADHVVLREGDGTLCERIAYSAAGVPPGVPLERRGDEEWRPSPDPGGTPLRPASEPLALPGRFLVAPRRATGAGVVHLAWELPWTRARAAVEVYDLSGARVARPMPEVAVASRGEREWRPGALGPGVYLVVLLARAEGGGESLTDTRLIRIDGGEP